MTTSRTVPDQVEITSDGHFQVRLRKEIVADNGEVIASGYHRTTIECGGDIDAQMKAVTLHLETMGFGTLDNAFSDELKGYAKIKWTPEVVKAAKDKKNAPPGRAVTSDAPPEIIKKHHA